MAKRDTPVPAQPLALSIGTAMPETVHRPVNRIGRNGVLAREDRNNAAHHNIPLFQNYRRRTAAGNVDRASCRAINGPFVTRPTGRGLIRADARQLCQHKPSDSTYRSSVTRFTGRQPATAWSEPHLPHGLRPWPKTGAAVMKSLKSRSHMTVCRLS